MKPFANDPSNIKNMSIDEQSIKLRADYFINARKYKYAYNFSWLGRPIIQHPGDILAMQEIVYKVQPGLIIETGIAHGGSLLFYASMLELIGGDGKIVGIDIDIRKNNRTHIENHPLIKRIVLIEGSSLDKEIFKQVSGYAVGRAPIMVILDSNHTHDHVLGEIRLYSNLINKNGYLIVMDTRVEDMPDEMFADKPWGKGNNPKTAVWEFLNNNDRFEIDKEIEKRIFFTGAPDGYLLCVKDLH